MMIGTCERVRSSRHTSTPEMRGSITSSSTSAGRTASKRAIASAPSAATSTRNPSRSSAMRSASRYDCSSSTTRISGASGIRRSSCCADCSAADSGSSGNTNRNVEPWPFDRLHGDVAAVGAARRGARSRARGRCHRCRGSGPGRPGRTARRSARGRGSGCRCRRRAPRPRPSRRCSAVLTVTGPPCSEYFTALSMRLASALTTCRRSHETSAPVTPGCTCRLMPAAAAAGRS